MERFGNKPRKFDRNNSNRGPPRTPPVNVGDELDVTIEAIADKGDGVAKKNGFVIFVPGTQQGEQCRIKVTKVLRNVGFSEKIGAATGEASSSSAPASEESDSSDDSGEEEYHDDSEDSEDF